MAERLICERCHSGKFPLHPDEVKEEEDYCVFCGNGETRAECLFQGQPACINCKMSNKRHTKSPAGSIHSQYMLLPPGRLDERSQDGSVRSFATSQSSVFTESRSRNPVSTEFLKANAFLQKYVGSERESLVPLYDSQTDGLSAATFHAKCDDCKHGIIVVVSLTNDYEVAGFSWKGIRRGTAECCDVQAGGAIIAQGEVKFVVFRDKYVINEREGIRFSRKSDLYLNFDHLASSQCNFDQTLAQTPGWTDWISAVRVYKLLA